MLANFSNGVKAKLNKSGCFCTKTNSNGKNYGNSGDANKVIL